MRRRRPTLVGVLAPMLMVGCGGAPTFGPEWTEARAQPAAAEEPALVLAPIALSAPDASEPMMTLDADGTVHHASCPMTLGTDGRARVSGAETTVLRVSGDLILAADGSELYRLEDGRLVRGDGRTARIEGDRVVFEESANLALHVVGADGPSLTRTALVLVAALAICGG